MRVLSILIDKISSSKNNFLIAWTIAVRDKKSILIENFGKEILKKSTSSDINEFILKLSEELNIDVVLVEREDGKIEKIK